MHILIFGDQHPRSLGGAQASINLQKKYLEKAGHVVTLCTPRLFRDGYVEKDPELVVTPSFRVHKNDEYSASLPGRKTDRFLDTWYASAQPVDVVHIQSDFPQALIGYRFARRHGIAAVLTTHTNIKASFQNVGGWLGPFAMFALSIWQRVVLGASLSEWLQPTTTWSYFAMLTRRAQRIIVPSEHFKRLLQRHNVPGEMVAVRTGVDDELMTRVLESVRKKRGGAEQTSEHSPGKLIWIGRFSPEKRIMDFLASLRGLDEPVVVSMYGKGEQLEMARAYAQQYHLKAVTFHGAVDHPVVLRAIAESDVLVQTSLGFETQGMTVFEAAALGTLSVVRDPDIAAELPEDARIPVTDTSVAALTDAVTTALQRTKTRHHNSRTRGATLNSDGLLQSEQTKKIIAIYEKVIAGNRPFRS